MALFLAFVAVALAVLALFRIRELAERVRALHEDFHEERRALARGWPPPEKVAPQPAPGPTPEVLVPRPAASAVAPTPPAPP